MFSFKRIEVINGVYYATGGNVGISHHEANHLFRSKYEGDYEVVPSVPGYQYKIAFNTSQDEMWFKLRYG